MNQADISKQKIMVVDDNAHYVRLLERILQVSSYQNILSLTDPEKVVGTYKSSRPDLLLMDIEMPGINGLDILRKLQNERKDGYLPVILFAECTNRNQKAKAFELGAWDVITKPFSQNEILASVKSFFERYEQQPTYRAE